MEDPQGTGGSLEGTNRKKKLKEKSQKSGGGEKNHFIQLEHWNRL